MEYTSRWKKLAPIISKEKPRPPLCKFVWGKFVFQGVVESVQTEIHRVSSWMARLWRCGSDCQKEESKVQPLPENKAALELISCRNRRVLKVSLPR